MAGCTNPFTKAGKDNSTAIKVALAYPDVADELNHSNDDCQATAMPADPDIHGYYGYAGDFYDVAIDTANNNDGIMGTASKMYLGHFKVLVDLNRQQVMAIQYSYDVATMPMHILLPAHAIWYQRLSPPTSTVYIEMNLSTLNQSIKPMVIDNNNIPMMLDHRPYITFPLSDIGGNAMTLDVNVNNQPVQAFLKNVEVTPGRMPYPGNFVNGSGLSLTFQDPDREYYFVLANNGPTDETVDAIVM